MKGDGMTDEPLRDQIAATADAAFDAWWETVHDRVTFSMYLRLAYEQGAYWAAGLVVPQPPNPPSDAKTLEEAWSEFRAGTRVDYDLRSTHDLVHIAFCAGWQGARGERVTPEPAAPTHEEMVQRWGVGFGTPYGNALYSWWLHMQREPTVEERSALMAAIDAGLRAGSAVPADPPATTLEEWTERNPKPWPWLGPDALLAWQQARDAAVPADPEEPA